MYIVLSPAISSRQKFDNNGAFFMYLGRRLKINIALHPKKKPYLLHFYPDGGVRKYDFHHSLKCDVIERFAFLALTPATEA